AAADHPGADTGHGADVLRCRPAHRGFSARISRPSSGGATEAPMLSTIVRARSTSCALVAFTPLLRYRLSSRPTRTWPPTRSDCATHGTCIGPSANDAHTASGGSCATIAARVSGSAGAP